MANSLLLIEANKKETQAKIKTKFCHARRKIHAKIHITASKNASPNFDIQKPIHFNIPNISSIHCLPSSSSYISISNCSVCVYVSSFFLVHSRSFRINFVRNHHCNFQPLSAFLPLSLLFSYSYFFMFSGEEKKIRSVKSEKTRDLLK